MNFVEVDTILYTTWQEDNGFKIILKQEPGIQDVVWDHNDEEPTFIQHGDLNITYQSQNGTKSFVWEQCGYVFYLTVYEELPIEEILGMMDSLTKAGK